MGMQLPGSERGRRRRHRPMAEINVTPFVDVMLVLLIIFMVSAPLLTGGVDVDLPDSSAQAITPTDEAPVVVTLDAEGAVFIGETPQDRADLPNLLAAIAAEREAPSVFLRADGRNPYSDVAALMGILQSAGLTNITLVHNSDGS